MGDVVDICEKRKKLEQAEEETDQQNIEQFLDDTQKRNAILKEREAKRRLEKNKALIRKLKLRSK